MADQKMYTVDKFLGLNEAADGETELKMGEASKMENFVITDNYNLKVRNGIQRVDFIDSRGSAPILASWTGYINEEEMLIVVDFADGADRVLIYKKSTSSDLVKYTLEISKSGILGLSSLSESNVMIFAFAGDVWIMSNVNTAHLGYIYYTEADVGDDGFTASYKNGKKLVFAKADPYIPLVTVGASPTGGGTSLENLNLLCSKRHMEFNGDGTSTAYVLPSEATSVTAISIDNVDQNVSDAGTFNSSSHTFTFKTAPTKGVSNVDITYDTDAAIAEEYKSQITSCTFAEAYNGSTDTRLFVAGNGSNIAYYSGVTESGEATPMYFPAMNEVAVDMSNSPITGMVRHYSKLMVFKPDGAYTISYEPVTLEDGSTIAGFYLRSANRVFGHEVMGQIQTVNNYPRTITKSGIYEWRITSSYYRDERYAKRISNHVSVTLRNADLSKIVTCDDNHSQTYYAFLNDEEGTVLVNRYGLDSQPWYMLKGKLFTDVKHVMMLGRTLVWTSLTDLFYLTDSNSVDAAVHITSFDDVDFSDFSFLMNHSSNVQTINAVWESGFHDFGANYQRKYSSYIYVSLLPKTNADVIITAVTDKRANYTEKFLLARFFTFETVDFTKFTFSLNNKPKINRVRLKVKKFVYYKLIFKVESKGSTATILGYDQMVRFGSMAK